MLSHAKWLLNPSGAELIRFFFAVPVMLGLLLASCAGIKSNPQYRETPASASQNGTESVNVRYDRTKTLDQRRLLTQIDAYLGVPYKWGGTNATGMDCSGFVGVVYKNAVNLKLPRSAREMYARGESIPRHNLRLGDLVFFENIESQGVSHVGIYVGEGEFAHASTRRGVIISGLDEKYYRVRYTGARRVYFPK